MWLLDNKLLISIYRYIMSDLCFAARVLPEPGGARRTRLRARHAVPARLRTLLPARQVALSGGHQARRPVLVTLSRSHQARHPVLVTLPVGHQARRPVLVTLPGGHQAHRPVLARRRRRPAVKSCNSCNYMLSGRISAEISDRMVGTQHSINRTN